MEDEQRLLRDIPLFLRHPHTASLLSVHPNQLCSAFFDIPSHWHSWWDWAGEACRDVRSESSVSTELRWLLILRYYLSTGNSVSPDASTCIPLDLRILLDEACRLQLTRQPGPALPIPPFPASSANGNMMHAVMDEGVTHNGDCMPDGGPGGAGLPERNERLRGMSPKKAHEVLRMTKYISGLLSSYPDLSGIKHTVDIGAGQAYLSRQLRDDLGVHVLALDWSDVQTKGAARRDGDSQKSKKHKPGPGGGDDDKTAFSSTGSKSSLTYKTIVINRDTLLEATDDWIQHDAPDVSRINQYVPHLGRARIKTEPISVLLVALHACGSLTPSILRAFLSSCQPVDGNRSWVSRAAVIVGCCYNMLEPKDFPLSTALSSTPKGDEMALTPNHLQLAAQVPSQWLHTEENLDAAKLAIKKVVWRALFEGILKRRRGFDAVPNGTSQHDGGATKAGRLGRLNDSVYTDWSTFLEHAGIKLDVEISGCDERDAAMESRLEVFHVLRCILGPVVETLILLDRQRYLKERLQGTDMDVQLVNLFNQASGSGRNVAIVIAPRRPNTTVCWP